MVRRATANSRAFMQRILHQLTGAARAGGDDSDDEETWEEQEDEHAAAAGAGVRRDARVDRRRRGPQVSTHLAESFLIPEAFGKLKTEQGASMCALRLPIFFGCGYRRALLTCQKQSWQTPQHSVICLNSVCNARGGVLQKPLEADVAWAVSRDTSADSVRQPMEPVRLYSSFVCRFQEQDTLRCWSRHPHGKNCPSSGSCRQHCSVHSLQGALSGR